MPSNKKAKFIFQPSAEWSPSELSVLAILLNAESIDIKPGSEPKKGTPAVFSALGKLYLPLEGLVDVEAEKLRLAKELRKIDAEITKVEGKLGNQGFVARAPADVLEDHRKRLANWQAKKVQLAGILEGL